MRFSTTVVTSAPASSVPNKSTSVPSVASPCSRSSSSGKREKKKKKKKKKKKERKKNRKTIQVFRKETILGNSILVSRGGKGKRGELTERKKERERERETA